MAKVATNIARDYDDGWADGCGLRLPASERAALTMLTALEC